jgi:hypothetical protein
MHFSTTTLETEYTLRGLKTQRKDRLHKCLYCNYIVTVRHMHAATTALGP